MTLFVTNYLGTAKKISVSMNECLTTTIYRFDEPTKYLFTIMCA